MSTNTTRRSIRFRARSVARRRREARARRYACFFDTRDMTRVTRLSTRDHRGGFSVASRSSILFAPRSRRRARVKTGSGKETRRRRAAGRALHFTSSEEASLRRLSLILLLVELALLLGGGVLVLLVLGHEVVHVRLGLRGSRRRKQRDGEQRRGKRSKGEAGSGRKRAALRTSVNSISSMPSPVYQWRKALRRNIEVNCEERKSANELANALAGEALAGEKEP